VFGWIYASHFLSAGIVTLATGETRDLTASYLPKAISKCARKAAREREAVIAWMTS
jgi:hypothetical protein